VSQVALKESGFLIEVKLAPEDGNQPYKKQVSH
jgi:hypothetical protein